MTLDRKRFRTELPNIADDMLDPFQYRLYGHYKRWAGDSGHCTESLSTTAERTKMSRDKIISVRQWLGDNGWITVEQMARGIFKVSIVDRWDENLANFSPVDISTATDQSVDISTELHESKEPPVDISTSPVDISTSPVDISTLRRNSIEGTIEEITREIEHAPAVDEIPVPENVMGIRRVRVAMPLAVHDQRSAEIKDQLPAEIVDPPSKLQLRLQAAQRRIPDKPTPTRRKMAPTIDSPHVKQKLLDGGYIEAGRGQTPVEVYGERFSLTAPETKLTMPLQDDLVRHCPDLEKLRKVITAYSQTTYRPRNMRLIFDWYDKGAGAPRGESHANTRTSNPKPATAPGANLGKAARVGRNEAKALFAHLYPDNQAAKAQ